MNILLLFVVYICFFLFCVFCYTCYISIHCLDCIAFVIVYNDIVYILFCSVWSGLVWSGLVCINTHNYIVLSVSVTSLICLLWALWFNFRKIKQLYSILLHVQENRKKTQIGYTHSFVKYLERFPFEPLLMTE